MRLAKAATELECSVHEAAELETPSTSNDDDNINGDTIYDRFVRNENDLGDCLKKLTNFFEKQFNTLDNLRNETICQIIFSERGPKCIYSPQELLFMLLAVLKQGEEWSFMATVLKKKCFYI